LRFRLKLNPCKYPMENETKTADFLNSITEKPDEIFKEEPSVEAEADTEEIPEPKEKVSWAKDEKLQRFIEKQVEKRLAKHESEPRSVEQQFRQEVQDEIKLPPSFIKLVGNDTEEKKQVLKDLSSYFSGLKGEARQEFLEELKEQEQAQVQQDNAALSELNAGFEEIEEEHGVDLSTDTKTRAAFVEYLRRVSHKNEDGEVDQFADIPAAWEAFQERAKPQTASRAKELASRGMTRSGDTTTTVKTGNSWKDVEKHFEQLKRTNN